MPPKYYAITSHTALAGFHAAKLKRNQPHYAEVTAWLLKEKPEKFNLPTLQPIVLKAILTSSLKAGNRDAIVFWNEASNRKKLPGNIGNAEPKHFKQLLEAMQGLTFAGTTTGSISQKLLHDTRDKASSIMASLRDAKVIRAVGKT